MIPKRRFTIFLPKFMWGNIFKSVFSSQNEYEVKEFGINRNLNPKFTEQVIIKTLKAAKKKYKNENSIPILIFPIASIFPYCIDTNKEHTDYPKIKLIGPAFKTRDDVFLFIGKNKYIKDEIQIIRIGQELTTTSIAEFYNEEVIQRVSDPIFHIKQDCEGVFHWPYRISFVTGEIDEIEKSEDLTGFIAAGPELQNFWRNHYWLSAVNLNAWICNKYKNPYFLRTFFVTIEDCIDNPILPTFYQDFIQYSNNWFKKIHDQKDKQVNGIYIDKKIALPTQIPAIRHHSEEFEYLRDISLDLRAVKDFMNFIYRKNGYDTFNFKNFEYDFLSIISPYIQWEIARTNKKQILINEIEKSILKYLLKGKNDDSIVKKKNDAATMDRIKPIIHILVELNDFSPKGEFNEIFAEIAYDEFIQEEITTYNKNDFKFVFKDIQNKLSIINK